MNVPGKFISKPLLLTFFAFGSLLSTFAETVRVTGWNLQGVADQSVLKQVAANLDALSPDVVLLQGVRDWQTCGRLVEALNPAKYHVLACSAFPWAEHTSTTNRDLRPVTGQVAVLAKEKAYASWSDPWQGSDAAPGGYVFAAIQLRGQRLGFICAIVNESAVAASVLQQVRQQAEALARWDLNRVQALVVGLSCARSDAGPRSTLDRLIPLLQDAGFTDTLDALAPDQRATVSAKTGQSALTCDFLLAQPTVFPSPLRPRTAVMGRYPVTCDLELDATKVAAAWTARAQDLQLRSMAMRSQEQATAAVRPLVSRAETRGFEAQQGWWWGATGAVGTACVFLTWLVWRNSRHARQPGPPLLVSDVQVRGALPGVPVQPDLGQSSSYTVVVSSPAVPPLTEPAPAGIAREPEILETSSPGWEQRARTPEQQAEQAKSMLRKNVASRLTRWLKQKFVRQLVSDRAQLLQAQQAATLQALQVDERLARIENQIRQQTQSYERRIEDLTLELLAAREENRELIRARIAQVKLEMETVRARRRAAVKEP